MEWSPISVIMINCSYKKDQITLNTKPIFFFEGKIGNYTFLIHIALCLGIQ
jgi:hypothetical protein